MKYYYKFYLWTNGKKTTELTQYLTMPIFYEDRLNEQLDTAEVILDTVPVILKEPFKPKTKVRLERYKTADYSDEPKTWDMIVEHDDVEIYVGCPELCCHRVSLIEPSAIAQGMHVDNIALTYELQDVTTNYKTYSTDTTLSLPDIQSAGSPYFLRESSYNDTNDTATTGATSSRTAKFKNTYAYLWDENAMSTLKAIRLNLEASQEHEISFNIPSLYCYGTTNGQSWDKCLFEMNTKLNVFRYETVNGNIVENTRTLIITKESGPSNLVAANNEWYYSDGNTAALRTISNEKVESGGYTITPGTKTTFENLYLTAPIIAKVNSNYTDKKVNFKTTTLNESEIEAGKGYYYKIELYANPVNADGMLTRYETGFYALFSMFNVYPYTTIMFGNFDGETKELADKNSIYVLSSFYTKDLSAIAEGGYLIMKGVKYSCFDLLRKALLTTDSKVININEKGIDDIEYSIILDPAWSNRLKTAKVQETILENKNLWEVFLQIGYYLHAIPYLQFATDGTDRLMLSFKQLGGTNIKNSSETKLTIFSSQNLNEYFAQYDSYVTNIFSPQNLVDEWLVVTTDDSSSLISNNTSILKTAYGISEVVEFDISYDGSCGGSAGTKSALSHIFEKSIYQILTSDYNISPSKGDSLYYELGSNIIDGLTYVPPSINNDVPMSLKRIIRELFSGVSANNIKFNNLKFHIKYRTQDSMRISQIRPDIQNFMKNSSYERYPKHIQYYGQQDKIVDSERFSLNLFGKLVRVGNSIYQCQEKIEIDSDEKESGDLVEINHEPYYVTEIENEFYPDAIFQKVTYSKNFNQLSQVVTIPSEPRFYEVSERSKIRREKTEYDFFEISTTENTANFSPQYLANWKTFLKKLLFNKEPITLPNYSWTRFMADKKRNHRGSYGQYIESNQLFPSSQLDRTNPNQIMPKASSDHSDIVVPLLHFPIKDGIIFEWDMEDNFKAGDFTDTEISGKNDSTDEAYYPKQSARYVDVMGRADLYTFRLFYKDDWTLSQTRLGAKVDFIPSKNSSIAYLEDNFANALDKDCREELSFNYQLSLLYRDINSEGNFVTFSNLFGNKNSELYCCLLDNEVSMFNENTSVIPAIVLANNIQYSLVENDTKNQLEIQFSTPQSLDLTKVKAIVFYEIDDENNKVSYLAKNFKNGIEGTNLPNLYIYPVFND